MRQFNFTHKDIKAFSILGISVGLKWQKIQEKFKILVKKFHPDMNSGNKKYEEKLKLITLAYTQLKNTYREKIDKISGNTQTVIGEALKAENTELIEVLLKFNTNLNVPLNDKDDVLTPLGHTLKVKNVQLMKLLLREKMAKCYYHSDINDLSDCVELAIATRNSEIINLITSKNDKDEL